MAPPRPFISQLVYSAFYFSSYGVVFPALFVANVVPGLGAVADGLTDGTYAACEAVRNRKARRAAEKGAAAEPDRQRVEQEGLEALAGVS
jgi:hypothetical protein